MMLEREAANQVYSINNDQYNHKKNSGFGNIQKGYSSEESSDNGDIVQSLKNIGKKKTKKYGYDEDTAQIIYNKDQEDETMLQDSYETDKNDRHNKHIDDFNVK